MPDKWIAEGEFYQVPSWLRLCEGPESNEKPVVPDEFLQIEPLLKKYIKEKGRLVILPSGTVV
jgi:hypothetical protein